MWTPAEGPLPWAASGQNRSSRASRTIAGIALPDPETAILASSDGALWIVPLRAPQAQLAALKPMRLQGIHGDIKAITYSHRLEQLVVAGRIEEPCTMDCSSLLQIAVHPPFHSPSASFSWIPFPCMLRHWWSRQEVPRHVCVPVVLG
jgi:hypothetical protein